MRRERAAAVRRGENRFRSVSSGGGASTTAWQEFFYIPRLKKRVCPREGARRFREKRRACYRLIYPVYKPRNPKKGFSPGLFSCFSFPPGGEKFLQALLQTAVAGSGRFRPLRLKRAAYRNILDLFDNLPVLEQVSRNLPQMAANSGIFTGKLFVN
jgi:hypothetical protein